MYLSTEEKKNQNARIFSNFHKIIISIIRSWLRIIDDHPLKTSGNSQLHSTINRAEKIKIENQQDPAVINSLIQISSEIWLLSNEVENQHKSRNILLISITLVAGLLCHFFSQHFHLIRLLKTTHSIEFLDSSNWAHLFKEKIYLQNIFKRWS